MISIFLGIGFATLVLISCYALYGYYYGAVALSGTHLGGKYFLDWTAGDEVWIERNGKKIIAETIVSHNYNNQYIVGLRLPLQPVICGLDGTTKTTMVTDARKYFVINKETNDVTRFASQKEFESTLAKLSVLDKLPVDYSEFDNVWGHYSGIYRNTNSHWPTCKKLPLTSTP